MNCEYSPIPLNTIGFKPSIIQRLQNITPKKTALTNGVSIFIPYRDRALHLQQCLQQLQLKLQHSKIPYEIIVVELAKDHVWNKGKLLNSGILAYPPKYDLYCFHDVDFLAEDDIYQPLNQPYRPFSHVVGNKNYDTPITERTLSAQEFENKTTTANIHSRVYSHCFGGIVMIPKEAFYTCNGFSNQYTYWGFEDLDLLVRLCKAGFQPQTAVNKTCKILPHQHALAKENFASNEHFLIANQQYFKTQLENIVISREGLKTTTFTVNKKTDFSTHAHVTISLTQNSLV